ncbi:MAG TPA: hypothetical protein VGB77_14970 [Abditibacteriaceae bacterium]|jgi:hypothetical protein
MKRIWFYLLVLLVFNSKFALCCSCAEPDPPEQALKSADAVFAGKVISLTSSGRFSGTYSFQVNESWKGASLNILFIRTGRGGGDCGYGFEIGQEYLVYAYGKSGLSTHTCSRTKPLSDAGQDLAVLGPGTPPSATWLWIMFLFGVSLLSILLLRFKPKRKPVE